MLVILREPQPCVAVRENHQCVALQILAEEPASVNAHCLGQKTALHFAIENGNVFLAYLIVDLDSQDPNICDGHGWTASSYVAYQGDLRMLDLLLTRTDLDLNVSQESPIYLAAERGHLEVVRRLWLADKTEYKGRGRGGSILIQFTSNQTVVASGAIFTGVMWGKQIHNASRCCREGRTKSYRKCQTPGRIQSPSKVAILPTGTRPRNSPRHEGR
jgi:hypothetical protein